MALSDTWLKSNNGKARAALEERGDREGLGVDHSRMAAKNKLFVKLCLMYGCRNGELRLREQLGNNEFVVCSRGGGEAGS